MTRSRASAVTTDQAERVGGALPTSLWHPAALERARRTRRTAPWAVAFSGGADSLALLLSLWAQFPERRARLVALHFNHRIRGRAAEADERFCVRVCAALGIRLVVGRRRVVRGRGAAALTEAQAREARLAFFGRALRRLGAGALWLAHQQDDVAETMLMRIARGSGTAGLAAPRPVGTHGGRLHLRPLLTLRKAALEEALRAAGVRWCEDATNAAGAHFRNRIRHAVLPVWVQAAGRDAVAGAALSRDRLEEDDAALEAWLTELAPFGARSRVLRLAPLAGKPVALWRRALHRWLLAVRPETDLSRQGFGVLLDLVRRGRDTRFSLGKNGFAVVRAGELRWARIRRAAPR